MKIDRGYRPARRLRRDSRKAAEESGQPKADAAFIGTSDLSRKRK
jgi:hypothetical protein